MVMKLAKALVLEGKVVNGFGRGGKLLNCPTANMEIDNLDEKLGDHNTGIYFGWAKLEGSNGGTFKTVSSIGWNPFFKNEKKTVEPHLIHSFSEDFYGEKMKVVFCGYLRQEQNFDSLEALKTAISNDISNAAALLDKEEYQNFQSVL